MKKVVELLEITEVPVNHIECSVCGLFRPPESYRREGESHQSRTNCEICYNLKMEDFEEVKDRVARMKSSSKRKSIERKLKRENTYLGMSLTKEELIEALEKLPDGARVVITQSGYYSDCELASFYSEPERVGGHQYYK